MRQKLTRHDGGNRHDHNSDANEDSTAVRTNQTIESNRRYAARNSANGIRARLLG
jgi:hypothetical protein